MRDSIVFYESWYRAINALPAKEKLKAYEAVLRYALYDEEPEIQTAAAAVYIMAKPIVDKNNINYENGKRGGRKAKSREVTETEPNANRTETESEPKQNRTQTEAEPYVNVNVNVNDNKKKSTKESRFVPPSVQQVKDYCRERGNAVNPEQFVDFYQSKNWMVGSNKMRDWRAAVRTWEKRDRASPNAFSRIESNSYDFDDLERRLSG